MTRHQQIVLAPVDVVWGLISDASDLHTWWEATVEPPPQGLGPVRSGETVEYFKREMGKTWRGSMTFDEVDSGHRRLAVRAALPLGLHADLVLSCEALDNERTLVRYEKAEWRLETGMMTRLFGGALLKKADAGMGHSLERLKRVAESRHAGDAHSNVVGAVH